MKKLLISFVGTMEALKSGRVVVDDLNSALFAFSSARQHVLAPDASRHYVDEIVKERPDLHKLLVEALQKAEAEGRVRWRADYESNGSFRLVNDVLSANGHKRLVSHEEAYGSRTYIGDEYCYPSVVERCKDEGIQVVFK